MSLVVRPGQLTNPSAGTGSNRATRAPLSWARTSRAVYLVAGRHEEVCLQADVSGYLSDGVHVFVCAYLYGTQVLLC